MRRVSVVVPFSNELCWVAGVELLICWRLLERHTMVSRDVVIGREANHISRPDVVFGN